jgi:hypothetical protein
MSYLLIPVLNTLGDFVPDFRVVRLFVLDCINTVEFPIITESSPELKFDF